LVKSDIYINNLRYKAGNTYTNLYIISDINYKLKKQQTRVEDINNKIS